MKKSPALECLEMLLGFPAVEEVTDGPWFARASGSEIHIGHIGSQLPRKLWDQARKEIRDSGWAISRDRAEEGLTYFSILRPKTK